IAEARACAVEAAERAEACKGIGIRAVRWPEIGRKDALAAEDAEVICLGDGSCDVIPAAIFVLGDGDPHPGEFSVDLGLEATQDVDRSLAKFVVYPGVAVVVVVKCGIPQVARTLHD